MAEPWPFVGRRDELSSIGSTFYGTRSGLVLAGEAGVGKSRLAMEFVRSLDPASYMVRLVIGSLAVAGVPLGAFAPFLSAQPTTPSGQLNLLRWASDELVAHLDDRRLVLVVDDADHLDQASAALVLQVASTGIGFILATIRSGRSAPKSVTALWKDGWADRIDIAPLRRDDVDAALIVALDGAVESTTSRKERGAWPSSTGRPSSSA